MSKINGIKAIMFDYGGTLDTNATHWAYILWDAYRAANIPINEKQFREAYVYGERQLGSRNIVEPTDGFNVLYEKKVSLEFCYLRENQFWSPSGKDRSAAVKAVVAYCRKYVEPYINASRELLETLANRYKLVLVTNFYGNINSILDDFSLKVFNGVIESAAVGIRKPDARIYELGLQKTGFAPNQTLVVGDSFEKDIVPAKSLGCHTVWLKGKGWKEEHHDESLPDAIIGNLKDLAQIVL